MKNQEKKPRETTQSPVPMSRFVAKIEKLDHMQQIFLDGFLSGAITREKLKREAERHEGVS